MSGNGGTISYLEVGTSLFTLRLFMDGFTALQWRPGDDSEHERAYDGNNNTNSWIFFVLCENLLGRLIPLYMDRGEESDRDRYINSDLYKNKAQFLSGSKNGVPDMGFQVTAIC